MPTAVQGCPVLFHKMPGNAIAVIGERNSS